jgi:hypothetical protein
VALIANQQQPAAYTTRLISNLRVVILVLNRVWQWPSVVRELNSKTELQYLQASGQRFSSLTAMPFLPQLKIL